MVVIPPGGTNAVARIQIVDNNLVESEERFDVILQPQGNGVIIGNPGQAEVIIVDDDGKLRVEVMIT